MDFICFRALDPNKRTLWICKFLKMWHWLFFGDRKPLGCQLHGESPHRYGGRICIGQVNSESRSPCYVFSLFLCRAFMLPHFNHVTVEDLWGRQKVNVMHPELITNTSSSVCRPGSVISSLKPCAVIVPHEYSCMHGLIFQVPPDSAHIKWSTAQRQPSV